MIKSIQCQQCLAALDTSKATGNIIKCEYCGTSSLLPEELRKALVKDNKIVFAWDVPYSLSPMAREAGLFTFIYQPSKCRKELLANRVRLLSISYRFILNNKPYLETFNPVNEDVNYEYFVNFVGQYLLACIAYPDAEIKVS